MVSACGSEQQLGEGGGGGGGAPQDDFEIFFQDVWGRWNLSFICSLGE